MWAPEGYLTFEEIRRDIESTVFNLMAIRRPKSAASPYDLERIRDFVWGDFFESSPSLSICSPTGALLRISPQVGLRLREPVAVGDCPDVWVFLNETTGAIRTVGVADRARNAASFLDAHLDGSDPTLGFPKSLNEYQWSCLELASRTVEVLETIGHFEGWAICCKRLDGPSNWDEETVKGIAGIDFSQWDDFYGPARPKRSTNTNEPRVGRKPKVPEVCRVYKVIYPNGHAAEPLKEVLRNICSHTEFDFSLDTLKRAISLSSEK